MAARELPPWTAPQAPAAAVLPPLKIYNSLTRTKTPFIPIKAQEKEVSWYACGPTVYDDAHLGHARNYVTTDIIRRIMMKYFGYKVKFVMNITDVDDKIILRGRQQHLLARFKAESSRHETIETAKKALAAYLKKNLPLVGVDTSTSSLDAEIKTKYKTVLDGGSLDDAPAGDREAKIKMHIRSAGTAVHALNATDPSDEQLYTGIEDILLPYLDSLHGSTIDANDHSIFTKLTKNYEDRFTEDMRNLNCLDPDKITRVTEYGPEIIEFVKKIQGHGFAYKTSDGSVYFDVEAFEAAKNTYARLEPWSRNDKGRQAEGEGALLQTTSEKKSNSDFALWKSSRPGEPSWPSPWGPGRPGWHIECSAMASEVIGSQLDIHSGGIDLAFPHHDNELAQSEAYWADDHHHCQNQWVNYFIHMGHLSIAGSKMSKSLKNYTTIREALVNGQWTPRSLRIVFLLGPWRDGIEVTESYVKESSAWEDRLDNFFFKIHDLMHRKHEELTSSNGYGVSDLGKALQKAQDDTYQALCDSFNTRQVMLIISDLVGTANNADWRTVGALADVVAIARWITTMVDTFGLRDNPSPDSIGWEGTTIPEDAKLYVYALSDARDHLRQKARSSEGIQISDLAIVKDLTLINATTSNPEYKALVTKFALDVENLAQQPDTLSKSVLDLCDRLRDVDLWDKSIYLEDSLNANEPALVRPLTKELIAAREGREQQKFAKQRAKEEREAQAALEAQKKNEQAKLSHLEMFKTAEYSAWDADGMPTADAEGKELPKSRGKKLRKDWERQKKLHESWLAAQK